MYKKDTQIKAWSFSRYSTYKQCPLKAKLQYIDKIKEPPNKAMMRGSEIHDLAEGFIKGSVKVMPMELKKFAKLFRRLKRRYKHVLNGMTVEDTWAFTITWDETTWNDWARCWLRVKVDCSEQIDGTTLIISDWKTGKFRPEQNETYVEQLDLYALAALLLYPHIETVKPRLVYLDHGIVYPEPNSAVELIYTRDHIPNLQKLWEKRVQPMLNDQNFAPRPNNFCSWCFFRKSNKVNGGGQCAY